MSKLNTELGRFLIVGLTTVGIDFSVYRLLLLAGLAVGVAKAIGFVAGTVFAYFANKRWTFGVQRAGVDAFEAARFAAVYAVSLAANVTANGVVLHFLPSIVFAFLVATGISATMNFLGMKFLVFRGTP
jgi:putative flippase GtrA